MRFWFTDSPHLVTHETRDRAARLLRAYRARPAVFALKRTGLHAYLVTARGTGVFARIER